MSNTVPLTVPEAIRSRRTTKRFKPDPIPEATLKELVALTLAAPSSYNLQPWRIILVDDPAQKEALAKASWNQAQVATAPVTAIFAASIHGGEKTMAETFKIALAKGAWTEKTIELFKNIIPAFQNGLGEKRREYVIKDAMIAATHMALAAESLGLDSCFMNGWIEEDVKAVIGAKGDPDIVIALLLPIGYGETKYVFAGRLPESITVFRNRIG